MNSSLVVGALALGFVIYVTSKGELPAYLAIFGVGANVSAAGSTAGGTSPATNVFGIPASISSLGGAFNSLSDAFGGGGGNQDFSGAVTG